MVVAMHGAMTFRTSTSFALLVAMIVIIIITILIMVTRITIK